MSVPPQTEWSDPQNWGDGPFGLYFSKKDPRAWVPKRKPVMGWTLNMAHPKAGLWLTMIMLLGTVVPIAGMAALLAAVTRHGCG